MSSVPKYLLQSKNHVVHEYRELQRFDTNVWANELKTKGHRKENRYSDVIPYESTRVKLRHPTKYTNDGYINASIIKPGTCDVKYIAAQGPLENTVLTFWQCVLEEFTVHSKKVVNVVMLTEIYEGNREKCYDYVNSMHNDICEVWDDIYDKESIVSCEGVELLNDNVEIREFNIIDKKDGIIIKKLRHIWIRRWPDFGVPDVESDNNISVIKFLRDVDNDFSKMNEKSNIIHCSAGVGRSGTFIALDWYYNNIFNKFPTNENVECNDDNSEVFQCVMNMRKCRVMMVQRLEQYEYLYYVLRSLYSN